MTNNITFIIQGKLNSESLNNLDVYLKYGKIIISCYENDNLELLNNIKNNENIKIIINKYPTGDFFNYGNIYMQSYTSYNGVRESDTEFSIKVRSDEYFKNLNFFINTMLSNPNKLTMLNVFLRRDSMYKFHMSDHIIAGKTDSLINMFKKVLENCENGFYKSDQFKPTESRMFIEYLKYKNINIDFQNSKNIMRENSNVVHISNMGDYRIALNNDNKIFINNFFDPLSINSLDEL